MEKYVYIKVLTDSSGNMVKLEIPAQSITAVHRNYEGLTELDSEQIAEIPYWEEFFLISNGEVQLAGTLSFPTNGDGPFPVVLLNSGTGPQDRDGNTPPTFVTYMFRDMAQHFGEAGIAVMRYDERGVGESSGKNEAATLSDLVSDVEALIAYLREHSFIDASRIAILGHSEGGMIGPLVMAKDPQLAAGILVAAPSTPLDHIYIEQMQYQASLEYVSAQERQMLESYIPLFEQVIEDAKAGKDETVLPINLAWLREHMNLDPVATISQIEAPILILQGLQDIKVMPYHAQVLADAAKNAGNQDVTLTFLDNVTHELTHFVIDNPKFDPRNPLKVDSRVFEITAQWLVERLIE